MSLYNQRIKETLKKDIHIEEEQTPLEGKRVQRLSYTRLSGIEHIV